MEFTIKRINENQVNLIASASISGSGPAKIFPDNEK
jgi:hypothetical protein